MSTYRGENRSEAVSGEAMERGEPDVGVHTILVVAKKTGIAMETLRAWERRYGFPKPARKEGSNRRLYSEPDVARLVALKRAIEAGYRIGDVVHKNVGDLGALANDPEPAEGNSRAIDAPLASREPADLQPLLNALANDDIALLEDRLRRAASTLGPKRFVVDVAHPFMVAVGEAWANGKIGVRHEHAASEALTTRVRHLLASYQDIEGSPVVLLASLPGEQHALPLQIVALYLAVKSARPRLVGINTPPEELAEAARLFGADVVGLTVTRAADKKEARKALKTLRRALAPNVPIWLGGGGARAVDPEGELSEIVVDWEDIDRAVAKARR